MDIFKLASKKKLRFQTSKGSLSTEQLWDLSVEDLDTLAVFLEVKHSESTRKSFLVKTSAEDKTAKLRFDVVLDVLNTKVAEEDEATKAFEIKQKNKKIISLIAEKQDESLKNKTVQELEAMLK